MRVLADALDGTNPFTLLADGVIRIKRRYSKIPIVLASDIITLHLAAAIVGYMDFLTREAN